MIEDYGIITSLVPVGGVWKFEQTINGRSITIEADDANALCASVSDFRARNNIAIGDVEFDVSEFIKAYSPPNNKYPGAKYSRKGTRSVPLMELMRTWLVVMTSKRPKIILEPIAADRAAVCVKCKHNVLWMSSCAPCNEEIIYRSKALRAKAAHSSDCLGACRIYKMPLPAAVFISREEISECNKSEEPPAECWIKNENIST